MTGHPDFVGPDPGLSGGSVRRVVTWYQTAGVNARLKAFSLLEAGAGAGAQSKVVGLGGIAPASRSEVFANDWDEGVSASDKALVHAEDRIWAQQGAGRPVKRPSRGRVQKVASARIRTGVSASGRTECGVLGR